MSHETISTNDIMIRSVLREILKKRHLNDRRVRIIEEMGVQHGNARIDIAVVNGIMHGYEIKSDQDTLQRLPNQIEIYNSVFNKITLVVGKSHLYDTIKMAPSWWGIILAKINTNGSVMFNRIREEEYNKDQDRVSVARLLWKEEALILLEEINEAKGMYSKPRDVIYQKLSTVFDQQTLGNKVREKIFFRVNWRPDSPLILNGD
ncbi:MAG: sce7726 family protein [Candidatus Pacebacteria bacterium]|nr:sce7726 family protein [Candidatus Paceibacterota bacterium]